MTTYLPNPPSRWFSNPWIGVIGAVTGVLGILVAIVLYFAGQKERRVLFYVNPAKAIVASRAGISDLRIIFHSREIQGAVTAAQVEIWNAGKESVRSQNILQEVQILTNPK